MSLSIYKAAAAFRAGQLTPQQLLDQTLAQIDRLESRIHAWVSVDRDGARRQAETAARELSAGQDRGPLHGIPIAVKDIFDVAGWPTAAGSKGMRGDKARQDATVVGRLRQAGVVIVGKTVTTAYASFDPPPTRNPWNIERTPGGSSSGSAAALASGQCLGALASQTGGSITRPAAYCGVVGCKPSLFRVSTAGVYPLAPSMDHPGVMAGCVRDTAIMLQAIAGPDAADPATMSLPVPERFHAAAGESHKPFRFLRLPGFFEDRAEPSMRELMDRVVKVFGASNVFSHDLGLPPGLLDITACHRTIMSVEAAAFHQARYREIPDDYGPCIRNLLDEGLACTALDYKRALDHRHRIVQVMMHLIGDDVILTPAARGPAPTAETTGDPLFNSPWSYLGFPTVCLPAGWSSDGLPLAIQLASRPGSEARLLEVASWCEAALEFPRREVPV